MRILYFFTFDYSLHTLKNSGSLDREIQYFEYMNKKYNHEFLLVTYGDDSDFEVIKESEAIKLLPIYTIFKKYNNKLLRYASSFFYASKLKKLVETPDLIKQNQLMGCWVPIMYKFLSKKKLFIRTGYDMYTFSKKDSKPILIQFLYFILTKFALASADIYSVSSIDDQKFLNTFKTTRKIELLPNWVENLRKNNFKDRYRNKLLAVGRLESQKNYPLLIKSFENSSLEIDIYGDGSLKQELTNLSKKYNVKINFLGKLNYNELKKEFQKYKIFISTSLFEGNPKSTMEAMSAGCIPVVLNIPNNRELITNEFNGYLFEPTDNLQQLVSKVLANIDKSIEVSEKSFEFIQDNYDIAKIGAKEIGLISNL